MGAPGDLTSLADCKAWLGVTSTSDDALVQGLVSAISQAILADLGRTAVLPATYQETLDGNGGCLLPLRHWPATRLVSCAIAGVPIALSSGPGVTGVALDAADIAPPGAMQRLAYVGGTFPVCPRAIVVTYRAGYEMLAEAATVPMAAPYAVTARAPYGAWCLDTGVTGATTVPVVASGVYAFGAADAGAAITLSYGYVPSDLARAACEWVADRYVARSRIGQASKSLGGQETTSFIVKAMPDIVSRLLQPYRRVAR